MLCHLRHVAVSQRVPVPVHETIMQLQRHSQRHDNVKPLQLQTCCTAPAGASTVYVYDHLSQPPLSELLADHIAGGAVQYTLWNHTFDSGEYGQPPDFFNNPQMHAYETCLTTHGPKHQFLGAAL